MDLSWLFSIRRAVACVAKLRAAPAFLYRRFLYFVLIEEEKHAARLRNEAHSVEVLSAHVQLAEDVVRLMQNAGFTSTEIKAAVRVTVVHRLRRQLSADGYKELKLVGGKLGPGGEDVSANGLKERRVIQLTPANQDFNRRASDADQA